MTANNPQEVKLRLLAAEELSSAKAALLELLAIPSVEKAAQNNAPFGPDVANALQKTADLAKNLGLKANLTPYYVTVDLGDTDGSDAVGVLSHVDVVPFGNDWHFSPTGEVVDNRIYGRGALDDKGPTVAALFAMSALKKSGLALKHPIRMIIGGNEESGSRCIQKYAEENPAPLFGFSPDADFPIIFAEKGITLLLATIAAKPQKLQSIEAGTVVNAVPSRAEAVICDLDINAVKDKLAHLFADDMAAGRLRLAPLDGGKIKISAFGKAAHGSTPQKGDNAARHLLQYLSALPLGEDELYACQTISHLFGSDFSGNATGIATCDDVSGALTLNLGTLNLVGENLTAGLDIRYPVTADFAEIWQKFQKACSQNQIELAIKEHKPPLYVPIDSNPAAELLQLYREYEPNAEPLAIGGGTYCRAFANFVAFGPLKPTTEDLMHQADEYITEEDLRFLLEIYTLALWRLSANSCQ